MSIYTTSLILYVLGRAISCDSKLCSISITFSICVMIGKRLLIYKLVSLMSGIYESVDANINRTCLIPSSFSSLLGQVVVLIGYSFSGMDISQELNGVAKEIHIACRSAKTELLDTQSIISNASFHPLVLVRRGFLFLNQVFNVLIVTLQTADQKSP